MFIGCNSIKGFLQSTVYNFTGPNLHVFVPVAKLTFGSDMLGRHRKYTETCRSRNFCSSQPLYICVVIPYPFINCNLR